MGKGIKPSNRSYPLKGCSPRSCQEEIRGAGVRLQFSLSSRTRGRGRAGAVVSSGLLRSRKPAILVANTRAQGDFPAVPSGIVN
jgi:hypothetical protein